MTPAMNGTREPLVAPFRIIADVSQAADGWRFNELYDSAEPGRLLRVPIDYRYLELADYTVEGLPLYIVRKNAKALAATIRHWPESFLQELELLRDLEAAGAWCLVVIEGSAEEIEQVLAAEDRAFADAGVNVPWLFAPSRGVAELIVFAVIKRAWQRAQRGW